MMDLALGLIFGLLIGTLVGWFLYEWLRGRALAGESRSLQEQLQDMRLEVHDLRLRLRTAAGRISQGERQQDLDVARHDRLADKLARTQSEAAELKSRLTSACDRLDDERRRLGEARAENDSLQSQLSEALVANSLLRRHEEENWDLQLKLRAADTQSGHLQGQMTAMLEILEEERQQVATALAKNEALHVRFAELSAEVGRQEARENRYEVVFRQITEMEAQNKGLRRRLEAAAELHEQLQELTAENGRLQEKLRENQAALWELQSLETDQAAKPAQAASRDRLQGINGIGPAYARRLHEAGIHTFAALAKLTPEQVRDIAGLKSWQGQPEEWIKEAQELVAGYGG